MADGGPPTAPAPAVGGMLGLGGQGKAPQCTLRRHQGAVFIPPVHPLPGEGAAAPEFLVSGRSACQQHLEDGDAASGDLSALLVRIVAATKLPQIVSSLKTMCK